MKKFILSAITILSFGIYSVYKNFGGTDNNPVIDGSNIFPTSTPEQNHLTMPRMGGTMGPSMMSRFNDGTYTGDNVDAYYGFVQVRVTISGGKISDVTFLRYPNDRRTSIYINSQAMPYLKQETITAQNANVDIVSGATQTSLAFRESLKSALDQAI